MGARTPPKHNYMKKRNKNKGVKLSIATILILGLGILLYVRWEAWFGNPAEEPYEVSDQPSRVLLTFGNKGEQSRWVSWMCGQEVDASARLCLADTLGDTLYVDAIGEVFESRAGHAAYYRVQLTDLQPQMEYSYRVENQNGCSSWYRFQTSDPKADRFSFLYLGDVQDTIGGIANQLLREAVRRHPEAEFVAFGGDLIERPMDKYWAETFRSIDSVCTAMPIVNITGNHDYLKYIIRKCERRFSLVFPYFIEGMEQRDDANHLFSFTYHNTDFFLLDSDRGLGFLMGQKKWLEQELQKSQSAHRIALLHHPLYSVKRKNNNLEVRWMFNELLQNAKVDLVLQGHEHAYTHCTSSEEPLLGHDCTNPPLYVVSHCSPKNYSIHPTDRFAPVIREGRFYQLVTVDSDAVTLKAYEATTQQLVDSVRITRKQTIE